MIASDIIYQALRRIGQLRPGYTPAPEFLADCLSEFQAMYDNWNTDPNFQFTNLDQYFPINTSGFRANSYQYTIGPSGSGADLICTLPARPLSIRRMNWVWTINTPTQPQRPNIRLIDESEWFSIIQLPIPGALQAIYCYYDPQYPLGVLNLWPPVQPGNQIEIYAWGQLTYPAAAGTTFTFPPGYWQATKLSLAELLMGIAPRGMFVEKQPDVHRIPALALAARNAIKNVNRVTPRLVSDMRTMRGGDYDVLVGVTSDYQ